MTPRYFLAAAGAAGLLSWAALAPSWHATVDPVGSSGVSGSADVEPAMTMSGKQDDSPSYRASLTILGAKPGSTHAWHVHSGKCGGSGGVVGSADAYRPITIDQMGGGSSSAVLAVGLDPKAAYHVNVHASDGSTVIACGDLTASGAIGKQPD